jgi:hypothetical protein
MMGRSQREKGKRGEREIASRIRAVLPEHAGAIRRGWQSRSGSDDPDVVLPDWLPMWIESKLGAAPRIEAALRQAIDAAPQGMMPVAITRRDRCDAIVTMRIDDWLAMLVAYVATLPVPETQAATLTLDDDGLHIDFEAEKTGRNDD